MLWLVTICLIALPSIIILVSSAIVLYFTNSRSTSILPTTVSIIGVALVLLFGGLVGIDVFAAERVVHIGDFIRDLYYITVSGLLCIVFGAVPFAYFFSTASQHSEDEDILAQTLGYDRSDVGRDGRITTGGRLRIACRNTTLCMCLLLLLLLVMFVLHTVLTEDAATISTYNTVGTMKKLFRSAATGHAVLNMTIGFLILLGTLNLWVYTALGLAALPAIGCIQLGWTGVRQSCQPTTREEELKQEEDERLRNASKEEKDRNSAYNELSRQRIKNTRERQGLYDKYGVTGRKGKKMPKSMKSKSNRLEARQIYLSDRLKKLKRENDLEIKRRGGSDITCCNWCWRCVLRQMMGCYSCIKLPFGIISMMLSVALWWSTVVTIINKFAGSGYQHGYVVHTLPVLFNPLDWLMRVSFSFVLVLVFFSFF
jgi:hypothetical protein